MNAPDRSGWDSGPWDSEGDLSEWESAGLACEIRRVYPSGHWCGTVYVPPGHPLHGIDGATLYRLPRRIAGDHLPRVYPEHYGEALDGRWYFGWDANHYGDRTPSRATSDGDRYVTEHEAVIQTEALAAMVSRADVGSGYCPRLESARLAMARWASSQGAEPYHEAERWIAMRSLALALGVSS